VNAGRAAGLSTDRLRGKDLEILYPGSRRVAGTPADLRTRCQSYATRAIAGTFFCSITAATLLALPIPARMARETTLHVGVVSPHPAPRSAGVVGHKLRVEASDLARVHGVWVTNGAQTWRELARVLTVPDLVAVGDHLLRWQLATSAELSLMVERTVGRPGAGRLRDSLAMLDPGSESPMESRVRAILLLGGLHGMVSNLAVTLPGVRATYRLDLAYPHEKVAIEFQGGYHHDLAQWQSDMTRASRLHAHGWVVMLLNVRDLDDPAELVSRVRRELAARGRVAIQGRQGAVRDP
jgi:hypothetical protein